jgi:N-acetylneuraminate synthase
VALGITMVEKHFTDNNDRKGPDHPFSMNPKTWKEMVTRTRLLELSLGDTIKKVEENEFETVVLQRRSIRVIKDLPKHHILQEEDLIEVRPCPKDAISPSECVIGKVLNVNLNKNDYLKYEYIR